VDKFTEERFTVNVSEVELLDAIGTPKNAIELLERAVIMLLCTAPPWVQVGVRSDKYGGGSTKSVHDFLG
jgi:hypothetical protein